MESFKMENQIENKDILDPDPMYFDFIDKQDQSKWEYEEALGIYFAPEEVIAEFIQKYLQDNNFRHLDIYKYCQKHSGFFTSMLKSYYRDVIEGSEMSDVIKNALKITPDDINAISQEFIESNRQRDEADRLKKLRENGVFSINGLEVIPKEKLVKFPEYLVQETGGVEGYLRRELSWKELDDIFSQILPISEIKKVVDLFMSVVQESTKKYYSLEEDEAKFKNLVSIDSLESFSAYKNLIYFVRNNIFEGHSYDNNKSQEDFLKTFGDKNIYELKEKIGRLIVLLKNIVDTLGDSFLDKENIHVMSLYQGPGFESFSDGMLKQKIFDPTVDESIKSGGTQDYGYSVFSIDSEGVMQKVDRVASSKPEDYKKLLSYLENGDFLIHGFGLNVTEGGIWDLDKNRKDPSLVFNTFQKPKFGFSGENFVFNRYMESIKELFNKQNGIAKEAVTASPKNPFYFQTDPPHPLIPVVIGHPDIPDLRWCHANHAYIPTKNGINVLKMISSKEEMENEKKRLEDQNSNNEI